MRMELKDTAELMMSEDYKKRFVAEYAQTKIRYEKLKDYANRIEAAYIAGGLGLTNVEHPKHDCPLDTLRNQQRIMGELLGIMELRAIIEHIDLSEVN